MPTNAEAIDRYRARCDPDVSGLSWYLGFARRRTGVFVQQLFNRYVRERARTSGWPRRVARPFHRQECFERLA